MPEITMSPVPELTDPTLRMIAERVARQAELAVEKVAASFSQPADFPLAFDPNSLERFLAARFAALPEIRKQAASARAITRIQASAEERAARLNDLAQIDLSSAAGIDAQVEALPFPDALRFSPERLESLRSSLSPAPAVLMRQMTANLEFRIHRVACVDETDGFLGSEAGSDEIDLGGMIVDESGDTEQLAAFRVRSDFDDGEQEIYSPPKVFALFDLTEGTDFPKSYFVTLVLAETDMGGLPDFVSKLVTWAKEKVSAAIGTAIGSIIGASGGPIGAAIGAAVGAIVGWVFDALVEIWEDDIFKPAILSTTFPSLAARWNGDSVVSPQNTVTFKGHGGEYQVTYDWRIVAPPIVAAKTVLYAVHENGDLLWYRHEGRDQGTADWVGGNRVGNGWRFRHVFGGGDGIIYAVTDMRLDPTNGRWIGGRLLWYRHEGRNDGTGAWAGASGRQVGKGWNFKHVFAGDNGVIYAIQDNGDLLWYRHDGRADGSGAWAAGGTGQKVGNSWNFRHVFSGGDGVIYAIKELGLDPTTGRRTGGDLLWYRHDGYADGRAAWAAQSGKTVGKSWHFKQVFSAGDGIIYAVQDNGDLLWYRHDGRADGSPAFAAGSGTKVGSGWSFKQVLAG
jgi:hypothetical protein